MGNESIREVGRDVMYQTVVSVTDLGLSPRDFKNPGLGLRRVIHLVEGFLAFPSQILPSRCNRSTGLENFTPA